MRLEIKKKKKKYLKYYSEFYTAQYNVLQKSII